MIEDVKLTQHFSFYEATQSRQFPGLVETNRRVGIQKLPRLVLGACLLEDLRAVLGVPLEVHSWLRFSELNGAVGGSTISQHLFGEAIDFSPLGPDNYESIERAFAICRNHLYAKELMFGQMIVEHGKERNSRKHWIHLSLGHPFRPIQKCRQVLRYENGVYTFLEQMDLRPWIL